MQSPQVNTNFERVYVTIHGKVQGVGFRSTVRKKAMKSGVLGCVWNDSDTSVRIIAEGAPETLKIFLELLRIVPSGASVTNIEKKIGYYKGEFCSFTIRII